MGGMNRLLGFRQTNSAQQFPPSLHPLSEQHQEHGRVAVRQDSSCASSLRFDEAEALNPRQVNG